MAKFDLANSHPRPTLKAGSPFAPKPAAAQPEGFTPMADLLAEMGLAPRPPADAEAPLVAPHSPETAEFSPPRPMHRAPTRFAHLRPETED
jgi:hypothetical protein